MAKGNVKKFLQDINKFVNTEYKRGALDKFPTIVTITKESLAQGLLEGYNNLKGRKVDFIELTAVDLYPVASKALNSGAGWAGNAKTGGNIQEYITGEKLVYSANRDIKRAYVVIKDRAAKEMSALLLSKGSTALKGKQENETASQSEIGVFKSGVHRGHQGITTVGSAQLSAAMKFLTRTKAMAGFATSEEASELADIMGQIESKMTTSGTKRSGGKISLKEEILITLEPASANAAGAQEYDYSNLRPKMEKAVADYVKANNIQDLPGSKSIAQNATDGAAVTVVDGLSKAANVTTVNKVSYKGRKKQSVSHTENFKRKKRVGSTKKAKKTTNKRSDAEAPMNISMILGILNQRINTKVASNMQSPALNYRTGRFAESVKVVDVQRTPQGFYSAGYTYQKYPYQTFEPGFAMGSVERDPRRLIDKSIREIAVEFAVGRFYTRRV